MLHPAELNRAISRPSPALVARSAPRPRTKAAARRQPRRAPQGARLRKDYLAGYSIHLLMLALCFLYPLLVAEAARYPQLLSLFLQQDQ